MVLRRNSTVAQLSWDVNSECLRIDHLTARVRKSTESVSVLSQRSGVFNCGSGHDQGSNFLCSNSVPTSMYGSVKLEWLRNWFKKTGE